MKKINYFIFTIICLNVFSCAVGGYWNNVDINLTLNPNKPTPASDVTVKCTNYDLFDTDTIANDSFDKNTFYKGCFNVCQNVLTKNGVKYNYYGKNAATFKEKKSNTEVVYTLSSNIVSSKIGVDGGYMRKTTSKECDKQFDSLKSNNYLHIVYPTELTIDKTSTKAGDKVTITSSKPFFDTATFSINKAKDLTSIGYNIVWYSAKDFNKQYSENIDKKAVPKENIDFDTLTPTSVTFTVPSDAITGTIHVINEGGFVCDASNDLHLVGNVTGATAYYSTSEVLTIIK